MASILDVQLGLKAETVFGTPVTVDHFLEIADEKLKWDPTFKQGRGLRVGSRVKRGGRRALVAQKVGGTIENDVTSKGMGILLKAALGSGTSTLIPGGTAYQQLFTPSAGGFADSYTIQKALPRLVGSLSAMTFNGMMCEQLDIKAGNADIVGMTTSWVGKGYDTSTAAAVPSIPDPMELLTFVGGNIYLAGTVTPPTATALATSGAAAAANIKDFSLSYKNSLDSGGANIGGQGSLSRKKAYGEADITGKMTAEYDTNALRDYYLDQLHISLVVNFQGLVPITGSVYPTLQICIPDIVLEGDVPTANGGDVATLDIDFTVMDKLASGVQPIYIAYVTSDTAI